MNVYASIKNESESLKESYDMLNVVDDALNNIERLKDRIDKGELTNVKEVSTELTIIINKIHRDIDRAW